MSTQPVSGRTRGEYYRPLNLDRVADRKDGWTFVCPKHQNYTIMLRPARKYVIDGEVIKEKGIAARFTEFRFFTTKEETAALIRQSQAFEKNVIRELGDAKKLKAETKKLRLKALLESDPELMQAAQEMLPQSKGKTPTSQKPSEKKAEAKAEKPKPEADESA